MAVVNSYFDFDDYNSPIKTYLDDQFYYFFLPGYLKETDVYIQQNSAEQLDSFFRYSPDGIKSNFVAIENVKERLKVGSSVTNQLMSIQFFKDPITRSYTRQVFSLLDVFGNIGGVNDILEITGAIIVGLFSGKIFLFTILSSMYQVDSTHIDQGKGTIKPIHQNTNISKNNNKLVARSFDMYEENKLDEIHPSSSNKDINLEINVTDLNNESIVKASSNMKKRYRYSYSMFDFIYNLMIPFKAICCCKNRLNNIHTRYKLFKKGQKKFEKEFDAVEFARSQKKIKMLIYWLMDKSERFLAAYQKSNAISLSAESES